MASYVSLFNDRIKDIDNTIVEKHILSRIAYFHNKFLNEIHPFADGNGRVCRIVIGSVLILSNCPPIIPEITTKKNK